MHNRYKKQRNTDQLYKQYPSKNMDRIRRNWKDLIDRIDGGNQGLQKFVRDKNKVTVFQQLRRVNS